MNHDIAHKGKREKTIIMNAQEIYKSRIEEAANDFNKESLRIIFENGANFILNNLWISVDEALPPCDENGISKECFVRTGFNAIKIDRYFANCKEWEYSHKNVTHWMPVPELKESKNDYDR